MGAVPKGAQLARNCAPSDINRSNASVSASAKAQNKTMHIRPSMTMVPLLATILVSPVVQAIGDPSSDARVTVTARSSRADLAVLRRTDRDLAYWSYACVDLRTFVVFFPKVIRHQNAESDENCYKRTEQDRTSSGQLR
jgi:hypothetical protein